MELWLRSIEQLKEYGVDRPTQYLFKQELVHLLVQFKGMLLHI
ncbi:hypothetical protein QOW_2165 [Clostridioides difficile Y215]|nr:hypothetical protein [Clostridioides difficile]EQI32964.1 hypothetical protein QOW_3330 [Clostridioides difficile Y215]EQI34371.1 hypothetical protein QOW_2165 [Clostridioides difficile Y215]